MDFYLIQNQSVNWTTPHTSNQKFTFQSGSFGGHSAVSADKMYQAFYPVFTRKLNQSGQQWPLVLEVINVAAVDSEDSVPTEDGNAASTAPSLTIALKGEMLRELHRMIYYGSTSESLQLRVTVDRYQNRNNSYGNNYAVKIINATELRPQQLAGADIPDHSVYEQKNLPISGAPGDNYGYGFYWKATIEVIGVKYICLEDILPAVTETNRKIFTEKKHCDFEIISEDGTAIPCHKSFLSAKSSILDRMLEADFRESRENKVEMKDMSTRGVNALLAFIYCSDVYDAVSSSSVALEHLKCADLNDMSDLWKVIVTIFLEKSHDWYEVDVALALFDFISKCERAESEDVMKRMIQVLTVKRDQLPESTLYDKIFNTGVAKKMFMLSLEANKST